MPELDAGEYLVGYLFDAGPSFPAGGALTYSEIVAWQQGTHIALTPGEARTLRKLSRAYVAELQQATDPHHPSPLEAVTVQQAKYLATADSMRDEMRALANM